MLIFNGIVKTEKKTPCKSAKYLETLYCKVWYSIFAKSPSHIGLVSEKFRNDSNINVLRIVKLYELS